MKSSPMLELYAASWPMSQLDEAIAALTYKSGLTSKHLQVPKVPDQFGASPEEMIGQWLEIVTARLGIEAQFVDTVYPEIHQMVSHAAPALIYVPGEGMPRFLAVLKSGWYRLTLLAPDLTLQHIPPGQVRDVLAHDLEAPLEEPIQRLLAEAGVSQERQAQAQSAILDEQLSATRVGGCWLLRMSPGANFWKQIRHARLPRRLFTIIATTLVGQIFMILGWWIIGKASIQGHFERAWLIAWALLLFTAIPFQLLGAWAQNLLSLGLGGLFKQRLLYGILQLEPEEIRHQGAGQFLGVVMESEALESLALGAGFTAIVAIFELCSAVGVLSIGAGGFFHAATLLFWMGLTGILCWYYYRYARTWITTYREMTNDLVERMVGHRTRLVQEDREHWHDEEDLILERYLKQSEQLDRIGIAIRSIIGRGWLIVGLAGIVSPIILTPKTTAAVIISVGGILLASQALTHLTDGILSVIGVMNAWGQVGPLFQAASRQKDQQATVSILPSKLESLAQKEALPVLKMRELSFRYLQNRPLVLDACQLQIHQDDRLLLEGPSGGGKSTLAALLTGLRTAKTGSLMLWGTHQAMIGTDEWRRRVVTAPQFHENHILTETFAFNLLMGRDWPPGQEDLEDAEAVCRELGLGDLLDRMPAGFQQMVGESGWQLSHGERSRVYIARALLQKADLIILDESFAALDPENLRRALQCVLNRAPSLLVIAHP